MRAAMSTFRRGSRGVGLVELMVTMLVGSMLVAGVLALFNANRQSFRLQDNVSVAQESGSFALDFIARDLRLAGYPGGKTFSRAIFDTDNSLNNVMDGTTELINGALTPVTYVNDQLALIHQVDDRVGGSVTCTGDLVPPGSIISNRYWVQRNAVTFERELVCQGFVLDYPGQTINARTAIGQPQALISGVDSFQVMYGIDTTFDAQGDLAGPCPQSADLPNRWVTAAQLVAAYNFLKAPPAGCDTPTAAALVRAVRIGLLVRTAADLDAPPIPNQSFTVLDETFAAAWFPPLVDGRIRRLFLTTVALRNAEGGLEE